MNFYVTLKGVKLSFEDCPLCTQQQLDQASAIIEQNAFGLFQLLPPDHIWRKKLWHIAVTGEVLHPIIANFYGQMSESTLGLLKFIYRTHDLGRVLEALRKLGQTDYLKQFSEFKNHAEASINILRLWGVLDKFDSVTQGLIEHTILKHFGPWTPELEQGATETEKMQFLITALLRDLDKLETFQSTTWMYLNDPSKKRGEIAMHGVSEHWQLIPNSFLEVFERHDVPDFHGIKKRDEARSYEGYMLYFLAWIFDVNLKQVTEQIIESNAITMLLQYFREHLPAEDYSRIEKTVAQYIETCGLSIAV